MLAADLGSLHGLAPGRPGTPCSPRPQLRPFVSRRRISEQGRRSTSGRSPCCTAITPRVRARASASLGCGWPEQADRVVESTDGAAPGDAGLRRVLQRQPPGRPRIRARGLIGDLRQFEAMQRSREKADALREKGATETGVGIIEVCEFELALAHLRVPEMAERAASPPKSR